MAAPVPKNDPSALKDKELAEFLAQFWGYPYEFVMAVFPWGVPGTILADKEGPEDWQREELIALGEHIRGNVTLEEMELDREVWRSAYRSGHGVGKSAMVAWIIYFMMSTRVDTRGAVTAMTQNQLEHRTWPELAKWHNLAINKHWFTWTSTTFFFSKYPEERQKNYMMTAATVSEHKTEAFQGLHNEAGTVVVIFDEASGVFSKVWEVAEGALSDGEAFFFALGNPTRAEGEFADCFDKNAKFYRTRTISQWDVKHTNKNNIRTLQERWGVDDDRYRVRVLGLPPEQSFNGFIAGDVVAEAMTRELEQDLGEALIMAVDVARFGDDETVIGFRQGRDARTFPMIRLSKLDTVRVAEVCAEQANIHKPDVIVIEATGPGAGVIDILRSKGYHVVEVHPGARAEKHELYFNRRAELWARMRDWLYEKGCLPINARSDTSDTSLYAQLTTILYSLDRHEQRIKMEAKLDMKSRGLPSPDLADTLALTFAVVLPRRDRSTFNAGRSVRARVLEDPLDHHHTGGQSPWAALSSRSSHPRSLRRHPLRPPHRSRRLLRRSAQPIRWREPLRGSAAGYQGVGAVAARQGLRDRQVSMRPARASPYRRLVG